MGETAGVVGSLLSQSPVRRFAIRARAATMVTPLAQATRKHTCLGAAQPAPPGPTYHPARVLYHDACAGAAAQGSRRVTAAYPKALAWQRLLVTMRTPSQWECRLASCFCCDTPGRRAGMQATWAEKEV